MQKGFGPFLKQMRQEKNLTQKELAAILFVSESTVSKWENNVASPDVITIYKLSEILGVSEHELITACIDDEARKEKLQAKRWRGLSIAWSLFFYISYGIALLTCFICNLAISHTLSWFWIVASALLLAFSFTNLPVLIKKHRLILLLLFMYLSLELLLGVCCIYTGGNWFLIPSLAVLLAIIIVFAPIYIAKYDVFQKIRRYNDFISIAGDFLMLNILLIVINAYTLINGYGVKWWYLSIAFPIVLVVYLVINLFLCVRFLKINKLLKTSILLFVIDCFVYLPPLFIKSGNPDFQQEINDANIFVADLSCWNGDIPIENNIHLIICLTMLALAAAFLTAGLLVKRINGNK